MPAEAPTEGAAPDADTAAPPPAADAALRSPPPPLPPGGVAEEDEAEARPGMTLRNAGEMGGRDCEPLLGLGSLVGEGAGTEASSACGTSSEQ